MADRTAMPAACQNSGPALPLGRRRPPGQGSGPATKRRHGKTQRPRPFGTTLDAGAAVDRREHFARNWAAHVRKGTGWRDETQAPHAQLAQRPAFAKADGAEPLARLSVAITLCHALQTKRGAGLVRVRRPIRLSRCGAGLVAFSTGSI